MKKFVTISGRFSPALAGGGIRKMPIPTAKPLGIPVLPGAPLMAMQAEAIHQMEDSGYRSPLPSEGDWRVAKAPSAHCIGYATLGADNGAVMDAEGHLELCHLYVVTAKLVVISMCEQVKRAFGLDPNGRKHHVFDLVVDLAEGSHIAA
jgi:hypothetical protein